MADWFSENAPKPQAGGDWFASNAPAPGFGQRLYQQTLEGPVELAKGLWNDPKGTLMKTIASMAATQIQAARNPVQVQQGLATPIIEDVRSGNWPGAAGGVTGLALDVLAPKLLSKAPGAAKVAGAGARAAAPDVASGAAKVGASYVMEHMLPGAGYLKYAVELPYAYSGAKQIGLGLRKGVAASREALKARAQAAAEALAAERAAAQPAPVPLIPEERRLNAPTPPPDTSYVRAVPAGPLPPSRQLAAPGRPAIITPAPDPLAGDTSGVRAVPAVYGSPAVNEAAAGVREAMDLQPGQFAPPAGRTAPVTARASQIDAMARHMRAAGLTAADAVLLDPPSLADLAKNAGIEGPLKTVLDKVRKRLAAIEKAEAETAKVQAAMDRLKPAERQVTQTYEGPASRFADAVERKPPATAAVAEPTVATPAEANVELGKQYPAPAPVEKPPALTKPQERIKGLAAILADGPLSAEQLRGGLKSGGKVGEQQRLVLQQASEDAGLGKPTFSELDQIVDEVERIRGAKAAALDPEWFSKSKAVDESGAPVRVYHGTQATFDQFSPEAILEGTEKGFFFTDSPSMAGKYAETYRHTPGKIPPPPFQTPPGANVRPSYLKMENPFVKDFQGKPKVEGYEPLIARAKKAGHDGLILRNIDDPVPGDFYSPSGGVPHDVYVVFSADQVRPAFGKAMTATERAAFKASQKAK